MSINRSELIAYAGKLLLDSLAESEARKYSAEFLVAELRNSGEERIAHVLCQAYLEFDDHLPAENAVLAILKEKHDLAFVYVQKIFENEKEELLRRKRAGRLLRALGRSPSIKGLFQVFSEACALNNSYVGEWAIHSIAEIYPEELRSIPEKSKAQSILTEMLIRSHLDQDKEKLISGALDRIGGPSIDFLLETVEKVKDDYYYSKIIRILGQIKNDRSVDALIAILNRGYAEEAARALANIGSDKAVEALRMKIKEGYVNEEARNKIIELLGDFGSESAELIFSYLEAKDKYFARSALISLDKIMGRNCASLSTSFLKKVSQIEDFTLVKWDYIGNDIESWDEPVNCSTIRKLAQEELERRKA